MDIKFSLDVYGIDSRFSTVGAYIGDVSELLFYISLTSEFCISINSILFICYLIALIILRQL